MLYNIIISFIIFVKLEILRRVRSIYNYFSTSIECRPEKQTQHNLHFKKITYNKRITKIKIIYRSDQSSL